MKNRVNLKLLLLLAAALPAAHAQNQFAVFADQPQGVSGIAHNGTVNMIADGVGIANTARLTVSYRGTAAATISSIDRTGSNEFSITAPTLPATLRPQQSIDITVRYTPATGNRSQGRISIGFTEGVSQPSAYIVNLAGTAPDLAVSYTFPGGNATLLTGAAPLPFAPTALNKTLTAVIAVANRGTATGSVTGVRSAGSAFQLSGLPLPPVSIDPGRDMQFNLTFAPLPDQEYTGELHVDLPGRTLSFPLQGSLTLEALLSFAYAAAGDFLAVPNNGTVSFNGTQVGRKSTLRFMVRNDGTGAANIGSISLVPPGPVFSIDGLPALPFSLAPKSSLEFSISYAPTSLGAATAALRIENNSFTLAGSATAPDPLPPVAIEGPAGAQQALQQPRYTLSLAQPYPLNVTGVLTLAFSSEVFANDATVQFATGGRSVAFTIPANTTRAVFPSNASEIRLQTGSVAGTITLTASFATEGGVNLTPANPPSIALAVPQSAPEITSLQLGGKTANSLSILVTGYSTTRSVRQMELQLSPVAGINMPTTRFTINVDSAFLSWYQSAESQQFGSLFTATVPITFEGSAPSGGNLVDLIQSLSIGLGNASGSSSMKTLGLR